MAKRHQQLPPSHAEPAVGADAEPAVYAEPAEDANPGAPPPGDTEMGAPPPEDTLMLAVGAGAPHASQHATFNFLA